jgi:hypothetical protein
MVLDSAIVALTAILSIADVASSEKAAEAAAVAPVRVAAARLWAPKKSKPRRPPPREEVDEGDDDGRSKAKPSARPETTSKPRPRVHMEDEADAEDGQEEADSSEEAEEEQPKVAKRAKNRYEKAEEEEEADEARPISSLPSILPRLVTFGIGGSVLRRSFAYDATLQGDTEFPRFGYRAALEAYPLLKLAGAVRTLGLGIWYAKEYGNAGSAQTDGSTISFPVNHGRWGFDLRYAIPLGERVVLVPAAGYGKTTVDLGRNMPTEPLMCPAIPATTAPCFGDVNASHLLVDFHIRIAATPMLAVSLGGGYLLGLSVEKGAGGIASQADASLKGFHAELGMSLLLNNVVALQAEIPFWRYGYSFSTAAGGAATPAATDQYYGLVVGIAVMTPP